MRYQYIYAFCLLFLIVASFSANANPIKYIQNPNQGISFDYASHILDGVGFLMADDWTCTDGLPITDIHWWGSYWVPPSTGAIPYSDWRQNAPAGGITKFTIAIYPNVPANDQNNTLGFAHPGNLQYPLWIGEYTSGWNETFEFRIDKGDGIYEDVYKYTVNLSDGYNPFTQEPSTPTFNQVEGTTYWLTIIAELPSDKQWGWHEACGHYGNYAVQTVVTGSSVEDWYIPCGGRDMAFGFTTIPEPASLVSLGFGTLALFGYIIKKRHFS
ncbi:MAG: hypothetical protein QME62_01005 [Armatimonadota bacterium]|nr:hypothetical protein [Armatimonadota bacterium]